MRQQWHKKKRIRLIVTLLVGLTIISTLGCATKKQIKVPLPPRPQIRIEKATSDNDTFFISRADLIKLEEYISALERAAK